MATAFTHAFVAVSLLPAAPREARGVKLGLTLVAASILPDLDVVGFHLGIPYGHPLGHRGFSHSLGFAALAGLLAPLLLFRNLPRFSRGWWRVALLVFLAAASHGLLDALTDGGRGVAFFLPLDPSRYFLPWRPLYTSPLEPAAFFQERGLRILAHEVLWVWLPVAAAAGLTALATGRMRRRRRFTRSRVRA